MEQVREELIRLFDDMLPKLGLFKKKTYSGAFEEGFERHKNVISDIDALCEACSTEEECGRVIEELAGAIPAHAKEKIQKTGKLKKGREEADYNLNMVVYVMPVLNYTKSESCEKLSRRMVEIWNKMQVTTLTLSFSPSYENIAGSFRKGFLGLFGGK